ncbi:MAG TPA: bifunctional [glutamine synthetase] adenylyltransferase/[glutamine synthetase]-adenylyl-L-tyrosine phosphorylase [Candidatus Agrococcus pullicola]|uniref:Bifunctional [glutamine synthetase] adenylyltransferase/[glutamine synthetase]-adenylyl-L-tyrosine phosphorylase n=1 Tax=Candidatus Agrococcus pullicola TaxID=2838429 RepID=A0A9D1YTS5_9MICO|nr:bifunctional [glutamine synthetase] adenylyltransferase/[glutamine synthetase]-adenylyl-L-tyrosine phosphorylase [Candidatus Agrococcus pullicola]
MRKQSLRAQLASAKLAEPSAAAARIEATEAWIRERVLGHLEDYGVAADPDVAVWRTVELLERGMPQELLDDSETRVALIRLVGASEGLAEVVVRIDHASEEAAHPRPLRSAEEYRKLLQDAVEDREREDAIVALRQEYRRRLIEIAAYDLAQQDPFEGLPDVASALSDIAAAALEAALTVARRTALTRFDEADVERVQFAIIGMGKLGAQELNYLSDVDVIWVHGAEEGLDEGLASNIAQFLARETTAGCSALAIEAPLWEVDANLRPEGKDGVITRTLASHVAYYERWAKDWEFQALLKARHVAGDVALGRAYEESIAPFVWSSSSRDNFVSSVHRMRERVTDNISPEEVDRQLKLGPGGLRDIEFTVQLLQLVHGAADDAIRQRATLEALDALDDGGYIGRQDAQEFSEHYRFLRLLEHRIQMWRMTRTHLMPDEDEDLRRLARSVGMKSADKLTKRWHAVRRAVRELHQRIFYRPLLAAVAALPDSQTRLTSGQAADRLTAIGFADAQTALSHIAALTSGVSRRAQIQKLLLPVLLQWFSDGPDPDAGLLAFRRLSEALGESPWYLSMLRDSNVAAERLAFLLSTSKLIASLMERMPQSASWIGASESLQPVPEQELLDEAIALVKRHIDDEKQAGEALKSLRRRELLRAAMASALGLSDALHSAAALVSIGRVVLQAAIYLHGRDRDFEFAIIAMGRTGGREVGFGSDLDVMYVCRGDERATERATALVRSIGQTVTDPVVKFELDSGLRPEGRKGPLVRSLESYRRYYERWSDTWEAQALLRAAPFVGDDQLTKDFFSLIDPLRYTTRFTSRDAREIRRIKARVEGERLPQNADRRRHLKLGAGSLSDVEWLVQLLQLQHAGEFSSLRTPSTLEALAALGRAEIVSVEDEATMESAWTLSSRLRNALALAQARTIDVLPYDRVHLETIARILGYPAGAASTLEDDYLHATRRARRVFERLFFE